MAARCVALLVVLLLFAAVEGFSGKETSASVLQSSPNAALVVVDGLVKDNPHLVAYGTLKNNTMDLSDGWAYLSLTTNPAFSDELQATAAGMVEGYLTSRYIQVYWPAYATYFDMSKGGSFEKWVNKNLNHMQKQVNSNPTNPLWLHVSLVLAQLRGLQQGYAASPAYKSTPLSFLDFFYLQLDGDYSGIESGISKTAMPGRGHCSVFVGYTKDRQDVLIAHTTWDTFSNMLRIIKTHTLNFQSVPLAANTVTFTSAPGWLVSVDDWYITSAGLVVTETTNDVYSSDLLEKITPQSLLYFVRNIVANRMANNGSAWVDVFSVEDSGTYTNQWIILDKKAFVPGANVSSPQLLTVMEDMPGPTVVSDSLSRALDPDQQGYWPSYNVPYFQKIYNISGYLQKYQKHGNEYSYTKCPRGKIFTREHSTVATMDDLKRLIRFNKWQTDPFSLKDPCNSIAARCDLASGDDADAFGAIDAKITSVKLMSNGLQFWAAQGPTHDSQPAFHWDESKIINDTPHPGQPNKFAFPFVLVSPTATADSKVVAQQ